MTYLLQKGHENEKFGKVYNREVTISNFYISDFITLPWH